MRKIFESGSFCCFLTFIIEKGNEKVLLLFEDIGKEVPDLQVGG